MALRRAGAFAFAFGLALPLGVATAGAARAATDDITFGTPTATSTFNRTITFEQPVQVDVATNRFEILLRTPGSIGSEVVTVLPDATQGAITLRYEVDTALDHVVPNTPFFARWRIVDTTGHVWLGPEIRHLYADDRFEWRTVAGDIIRVHWYQGSAAFGRRALKIGEDAVASATKLLGVDETEPLDFFIYADLDKFYDALGPSTQGQVGGQARSDIRTLFALIEPDEINASWVDSVISHELVHLVVHTAVENPYHDPPRWLNEGLAVYLSDGVTASHRSLLRTAAREGTLVPLSALSGAFPRGDRFSLAYAESVSAVERIAKIDDRKALVTLIRSYKNGVSDDEAFKAALGQDLAGFEAAWLAAIGAKPAASFGPQPAPPGPLPPGWAGAVPEPSIGAAVSAPPGAVVAPAATPPAAASPVLGDASSERVIATTLSALVVIVTLMIVARLVRRDRASTRATLTPHDDDR
jgi:hypothetical protein